MLMHALVTRIIVVCDSDDDCSAHVLGGNFESSEICAHQIVTEEINLAVRRIILTHVDYKTLPHFMCM